MLYINFRNIIISIAFISLISFPILNEKFKIVKDIENTENRKPAAKPSFDVNHLDAFTLDYNKYYTDNFSIRQRLVKYFNQLNLLVFKKSPIPDQIIIGKEGWIFLAGNDFDSYSGKHRLDMKEMEELRLELEYRKKYLEKRNCKLYFLVVPVKANIYPEFMPLNSLRLKKQSWGEQIIEYLNKNSDVNVINIFNSFQQSKQNGLLYYRLDNHWNQKGGFFAANEVLKQINKDISSVKPLSYSDFIVKDSVTHGGNISGMLSNIRIFTDTVFNLIPKSGFKSIEHQKVGYKVVFGFPYPWDYELVREIPHSNEPKILIISDSFGGNIYPFISESFSRSVKIFDSWEYKLNEDIVNNEKPDVVLLITVESNIRNMLGHQSRLHQQ